jgi:hypothetical protein
MINPRIITISILFLIAVPACESEKSEYLPSYNAFQFFEHRA